MNLDCPDCRRRIAIQPHWMGKRVRCPHCKNVIAVSPPAKHQLADDVSAQQAPRSPQSSGQFEATIPHRADAPSRTSPERSRTFAFLHPPQSSEELGRLGGYRIKKVLGEGGMGLVFHAEELSLGRPVALKVIRPELVDQRAKERFLREAQAAAIIDHERVITIYHVGEDDGVPFVAMRLLQGQSLKDRLQKGSPLPIPEVVRIGQEIAEGLAAAHDKGLIHRDIKPSNIWLEGNKGNVKLLDFGLVKRGGSASDLSQSGTILGTPAYMAPEQAVNRNVDARCDLFSLGCVLYQCCTGRRPFHGEDLLAVLSAIANAPYASLASLNSRVPQSLIQLIDQLLAKRPEQRPANAHEVREALAAIREQLQQGASSPPNAIPANAGPNQLADTASFALADSKPLHAKPVSVPARGSFGRMWLIGTTMLLLTVILVVAFFMMGGKPTVERPQQTPLAKGNNPVKKTPIKKPSKKTKKKGGKNIKKPQAKPTPPIPPPKNDKPFYDGARCEYIRGKGQDSRYGSLIYSPDGKWIATGGPANTVKIWSTQTKTEQCTCKGHNEYVTCAAFSRDGKRLVTGSRDKTVMVWDTETGKPLLAPGGIRSTVRRVAFSPDGLKIAACFDSPSTDYGQVKTVTVWDARTNKELFSLKHTDKVACIAFRHDGNWLATASGKTVQIWDMQSGKEIRKVNDHAKPVTCVAFSPDGTRLASGSERAIRVANCATGKIEFTYKPVVPYQSGNMSVAFSPDGKRIVAGGSSIAMWDVETGKNLLALFDAHGGGIAFRPDGKSFVTTAMSIAVWIPVNKKILTFAKHTYAVEDLAVDPVGDRIASAAGMDIFIWKRSTGKKLDTLNIDARDGTFTSVAFSPDGQYIAAGFSQGKTVKVWNTTKRIVELELVGHTSSVLCVAYSRDGKRIVTGGLDRTVRVWNAATGNEICTLKGHTKTPASVAISPDGRRVVSTADYDSVKVWDATTGEEIRSLDKRYSGSSRHVAFSPDGKRFATIGRYYGKLWETETGQEVFKFGATRLAQNVTFDPQGKYIAIAGYRTIRLYEATTGDLTLMLNAHTDLVTSLAFSPDGQQLISGSKDGTIQVWELSGSAE